MRSTNAAILLETLTLFLAQESPDTRAGVGYSGGRDSATLLWALVQVWGSDRVEAIHVDHGWRTPAERLAEAALVARWCQTLGVPLVSFGPPMPLLPTESGARIHRYQCFEQFLEARPKTLVFLAHHAEDQAETILMRLLKGRSWQGLSGMPARRGPYRRPFLSLSRAVVAGAASERGVPVFEDSTNVSVTPSRNFLRHQIFPALQARFPRAVGSLVEFGALWGQASLLQSPHAAWTQSGECYRVAAGQWDLWSPLERQAQLLALANRADPHWRPSRRFLETLTRPERRGRCRGARWEWTRRASEVTWGPISAATREYYLRPAPHRVYDLGGYRFSWGFEAPGLWVPGDPGRPWVWRSAVAGMVFSSKDKANWGKDLRRRRLGSLDPQAMALVLQDGLVRAVVDPRRNRVVWSDSEGEKLHKTGIFVNLLAVTPNSTE